MYPYSFAIRAKLCEHRNYQKDVYKRQALLFDRITQMVEGEKCALMVLHDPALALDRCHRLLLLDGGRLVDDIIVAERREEELQAALRRLYPSIRVRREAEGRFYCLPD